MKAFSVKKPHEFLAFKLFCSEGSSNSLGEGQLLPQSGFDQSQVEKMRTSCKSKIRTDKKRGWHWSWHVYQGNSSWKGSQRYRADGFPDTYGCFWSRGRQPRTRLNYALKQGGHSSWWKGWVTTNRGHVVGERSANYDLWKGCGFNVQTHHEQTKFKWETKILRVIISGCLTLFFGFSTKVCRASRRQQINKIPLHKNIFITSLKYFFSWVTKFLT